MSLVREICGYLTLPGIEIHRKKFQHQAHRQPLKDPVISTRHFHFNPAKKPRACRHLWKVPPHGRGLRHTAKGDASPTAVDAMSSPRGMQRIVQFPQISLQRPHRCGGRRSLETTLAHFPPNFPRFPACIAAAAIPLLRRSVAPPPRKPLSALYAIVSLPSLHILHENTTSCDPRQPFTLSHFAVYSSFKNV